MDASENCVSNRLADSVSSYGGIGLVAVACASLAGQVRRLDRICRSASPQRDLVARILWKARPTWRPSHHLPSPRDTDIHDRHGVPSGLETGRLACAVHRLDLLRGSIELSDLDVELTLRPLPCTGPAPTNSQMHLRCGHVVTGVARISFGTTRLRSGLSGATMMGGQNGR